jgi:mRNA interferase RelE/StbE
LAWQIRVSETASRQLDKMDRPVALRITKFLRERVAHLEDPRSIGEALKGSQLGGLWKYRVGDWRIICEIKDAEIVITVLTLGNRREIYR